MIEFLGERLQCGCSKKACLITFTGVKVISEAELLQNTRREYFSLTAIKSGQTSKYFFKFGTLLYLGFKGI